MGKIVLSTVGTSLKTNLQRAAEKDEEFRKALENYQKGNLDDLLRLMLNENPSSRILGAEINSLHSLFKSGYVDEVEFLVFLVSDTDDGEKIGKLLAQYFKRWNGPKWESKVERVENLRDDDAVLFRSAGLRNLIKKISNYARNYHPSNIIVNATGGYKAQILFAGALGQALGIPVYYMFERFSSIISLPPLPISLDMELWMKNNWVFYFLENDLEEEEITNEEKAELEIILRDELMKVFVDIIEADGKRIYGLSPAGQIFHEHFKLRFPTELKLPPASGLSPEEKVFVQEGGAPPDRPPGIEDFIKRIFREKNYVTRASSFYYNKDLSERTKFKPSRRTEKGKKAFDMVLLVYSDGKATAKVNIFTTARNEIEMLAAVADLNMSYVKG